MKKKILVSALALMLALSLCVPAMAVTLKSDAADASPFRLSVYLVDYANRGFFGVKALPAVGRAYVAREIVAAVVELYVPANADPSAENTYYGGLVLSGVNLSLNTAENAIKGLTATLKEIKPSGVGIGQFIYDPAEGTLSRASHTANLAPGSAFTYKWLVFGKVTGDNAKLTATLTGGDGTNALADNGSADIVINGVTYEVVKHMGGAPYGYDIYVESGVYQNSAIQIYTDSEGKTAGMGIRAVVNGVGGGTAGLGVSVNGGLGYYDPSSPSVLVSSAAQATSGPNRYATIMAVYDDVVRGVFGMDYFRLGGYVNDGFFTAFGTAKTLTATVDISHARAVPKASKSR